MNREELKTYKYKIGDNIVCRGTGYFVFNASVKGKIVGYSMKKTIFGKLKKSYFIYTEDFNKRDYAINSLIVEVEEKNIFYDITQLNNL